jgi:hypothetical protein
MRLNMKLYNTLLFAALALTACAASSNLNSNNSSNAVSINTPSSNVNVSSTTSLADARVPLGDGRVSFIPPANLKPLTKDQIASSKFSKMGTQHVFANDSQTVSVVITFLSMDLVPELLPEYKESMERLLSSAIPDVQWVAREIVVINGRKWVHLEVASEAPDADLHNHQYTTSLDGRALVFGFNSTVKEYPQVKDAFLRSAQTMQVKD